MIRATTLDHSLFKPYQHHSQSLVNFNCTHNLLTPTILSFIFRLSSSYNCIWLTSHRAFSQAAPAIWNDLPLDSRSAVTYERFRSATKKHFTNWLSGTDHVTVSAPMIRFLQRLMEHYQIHIIIIIIIIKQTCIYVGKSFSAAFGASRIILRLHRTPYLTATPTPAESRLFFSYWAIFGPSQIWPQDMRPNLCKCSKHSSAYFSADTVQQVIKLSQLTVLCKRHLKLQCRLYKQVTECFKLQSFAYYCAV